MSREVKVTFEPSGRGVFVLPGTILLEAAARVGFIIETPCGGAGQCGKCVVRVTSGACLPCEACYHTLSDDDVARGYRLACQCRVDGALVVEIPETSLFQTAQKILSRDSGEPTTVEPTIVKRFLELSPPDRDDGRSDVSRVRDALGNVEIDPAAMPAMPDALRAGGFRVTATLSGNRLIRLDPGDTRAVCFGVAFDIGTTTLVGTLVDLNTGADRAVSSRVNPQTSFGDDVISRIKRCRDDAHGLAALHDAVLKATNAIVDDLAKQASIAPDAIVEAVISGNTTMQQIFCRISPVALGEIPFVPAFEDALTVRAADVGLKIYPYADVQVFPQIGGFVGGDTVAGILATRLQQSEAPALLVDVGTNGEIVLANRGALTATSVAAGPAFEGARIVNGMRAARGAIEKVVFNDDVEINVIGNAKPTGLCGTGLIDAAAGLLDAGILDITGRILGPDEMPATVSRALRRRAIEENGQCRFVLVDATESGTSEALCLYQRDIRELQLATGAIRAGIAVLLKEAGLRPEDLGAVLLAGAFGNFIRRNHARRIGMLPPIPTERIRFVGNTASSGAKRMLLSRTERAEAERLCRATRHVDLSLNPDFQMEFSQAMLFPEADAHA
jgi:uncharacterized 2Fe-2S/4Fe-4S cluster protein (DUF4445 family)